jgi:hypothetical protein
VSHDSHAPAGTTPAPTPSAGSVGKVPAEPGPGLPCGCSGGPDKKAEADAFAYELLMPRRLVARAFKENPGITVSELAKMFNVSEGDMTQRILKLRLSDVQR